MAAKKKHATNDAARRRRRSPALDLTLNAALAEWSAAQHQLAAANVNARAAAKARLELVIKVAKLEARIAMLDELAKAGLTP